MMRLAAQLAAVVLIVSVVVSALMGQGVMPVGQIRFAYVEVYIDSHDQPLAAYQFELAAMVGDVKIVGIEGNRDLPFRDPPYHDPAAMQQDRVIIAAFSTADAERLPTGRTRLATVHVMITGDIEPEYAVELVVASTVDAREIPAKISLVKGTPNE